MKKINGIVLLILCSLFFVKGVRPVRAEEPIQLIPEKVKMKLGVSEDVGKIDYDNLNPVLKGTVDYLTPGGLKFKEGGIIKSTRGGVVYEGPLKFIDTDNQDFLINHQITAVEAYNKTKFADGKTEFTFLFNFLRNLKDTENGFTEKISEVSLVHQLTKNQIIMIGQARRLPIGLDGMPIPQKQDTAIRSQIARTFSNTRAFGVRNVGDYKYMDYDIGVYDSTRYMQDFFNGTEFVAQVNVKPLANLDEKKYGKLMIGSSGQFGKAKYDYKVAGAHLAYDYKKAHAKLEYMHADGYNGNSCSNKKAGGFSSTVLYEVTPKLQVVGRYDMFDPDTKIAKNNIAEYTAGVNYIVSRNLKFVLNYVRQNKENGPDSNMFYFVTRFMI